MNVATEQEAYLEAVKRALADIDPASRDELLEDLPEHLAEVAAEGEGTLAERLGPPEAYAAELRVAAGLGAAAPASRRFDDRVATAMRRARDTLGIADRKVGPVIGYARASEFLRLLRPAWWVLRGYLVAMAITVLTTGGGFGFGFLPRVGGSLLAAVLMLAVCVTASIWLGRREPGLPAVPRAGIALAGVALFIFGFVGFQKAENYGAAWIDERLGQVANNPYEYVQDVYVYDEAGQPLTNVRLFDQDGNPIQLGDPYRCQESYAYQQQPGSEVFTFYPFCPGRPPYLVAPRPGVPADPRQVVITPTPVEVAPTEEPSATPVPSPTN